MGITQITIPDYNSKAKALLAEAGFPNGISEPIKLLYADAFWHQEPVAIQVADMLKKIGVTVQPTRVTTSEMRAKGSPKDEYVFLRRKMGLSFWIQFSCI